MHDDYIGDVIRYEREHRAELDAMVRRRFAVEGLPLEVSPFGGVYVARRGSFVGVGVTEGAALADLRKKIDLHFGGKFTA